jgi:hypothetical protein
MYSITLCDKKDIFPLLKEHHYLSKISRGFKTKFNVGLQHKEKIVGACIFTGFPVPELAKGCFGLERNEQEGLWELSRFVLHPEHQLKEHNLSTWFMSRAIKELKRKELVRAILSYADNDEHSGVIYAASNFKYYGLSSAKKDFWIKEQDGTFKKHSRGKIKGVDGEWRPRSQKHRFLLTFDKKLDCRWQEEKWKNKKQYAEEISENGN